MRIFRLTSSPGNLGYSGYSVVSILECKLNVRKDRPTPYWASQDSDAARPRAANCPGRKRRRCSGRPRASPQGTIERALDTRLTARARAPASWPLLSACQWASWPPVDVLNPKTEASRGPKNPQTSIFPGVPRKGDMLGTHVPLDLHTIDHRKSESLNSQNW